MIERIGNLAERLATNVGQSRRGFLAGVGKAALGAAGALGALLALPGAARAAAGIGHCVIAPSSCRGYYYTGACVTSQCAYGFSSVCSGGAPRGKLRCGGMVGKKCSF